MKKLLTLLFAVFTVSIFAQVNVTFQVDMTGQTVSTDGVHIVGSLNGWNTSSDMLTDQGSNIYSVTLSLTPGEDHQYKFLNGNAWGTEEVPPASCSIGGNNRTFTTPTADATFDVIPFNGCPTPNPTQDITFTIDMTGQTVSGNGVHIAGNFNAWTPDAITLTDMGNNIYQVTATVLSSLTTIQFKFLNGNSWGTEETVPVPCANSNSNRYYDIEGAGALVDLPIYEFGTCAETPLPVSLVFFKGQEAADGSVVLEWQTASEENNEGFEVERSSDGRDWESLSFVKGDGTSLEILDYDYLDNNPFTGVNYYRLKQIDFDGEFEYSEIVSVALRSPKSDISIFPNPVNNEINIINASGVARLFNSLGQPLRQVQIDGDAFRMDVNDLPTGTYLLMVWGTDGSEYTTTIIK